MLRQIDTKERGWCQGVQAFSFFFWGGGGKRVITHPPPWTSLAGVTLFETKFKSQKSSTLIKSYSIEIWHSSCFNEVQCSTARKLKENKFISDDSKISNGKKDKKFDGNRIHSFKIQCCHFF